MIYAAWLVIVIWGLLSLPLFLWLMGTAVQTAHFAGHRSRWRTRAVAVVCLSDVLCAVAIGWLLRGHWLVSLLIGTAFFLLRMILADSMGCAEEPEIEITLSGTEGEFREQLIWLMERKRHRQLLRERTEQARRSGESLAPVVREQLPRPQRWSRGDTLGLAGVFAACGALNLAFLTVLLWLFGHFARS